MANYMIYNPTTKVREQLENRAEERDLGVIIDDHLQQNNATFYLKNTSKLLPGFGNLALPQSWHCDTLNLNFTAMFSMLFPVQALVLDY